MYVYSSLVMEMKWIQVGSISHRVPMVIKFQHDQEVEEVLVDRMVRHSNQPPTYEPLVKWKGLLESEASGEPIQNFWQFKTQIQAFEDKKATRLSAK